MVAVSKMLPQDDANQVACQRAAMTARFVLFAWLTRAFVALTFNDDTRGRPTLL
jgi:hypothetical protein